MRFAILIIGAMVTYTAAFASGTTVGNGGNGIVCKGPSGSISSVELLDYFELRQSGGTLKLNTSLGKYDVILKDLFKHWQPIAPKRMALYEQWLSSFESEAGFYSGIQIAPTEDTGVISIPAGCDISPVVYQRPDEQILPGVKRYTFSKDLWDHMSEVQRAGLVLHELIYREGIKAGHTTSFPTRYFTGYLSSATPQPIEYARVVQQLPLKWVEYGSGLVLELGELQFYDGKYLFAGISKVTEEGFVTGYYYNPASGSGDYLLGTFLGIMGDVLSERLKIRFTSLSPKAADRSGKIVIFNDQLFLSDLGDTQVKSIFTSVDQITIEADSLPIHLWDFRVYVEQGLIQVSIASPDPSPDGLRVNPAVTSYVQPDGSVIRSIAKLLKSGDDPHLGDIYGSTFVTSSGDVWSYDATHRKYIKK